VWTSKTSILPMYSANRNVPTKLAASTTPHKRSIGSKVDKSLRKRRGKTTVRVFFVKSCGDRG